MDSLFGSDRVEFSGGRRLLQRQRAVSSRASEQDAEMRQDLSRARFEAVRAHAEPVQVLPRGSWKVLGVVALLLVACGPTRANKHPLPDARLKVCIGENPTALLLEIKSVRSSISLRKDLLPWMNRVGLVLQAVRPDRAIGALPEAVPISDPATETVTLKAGDTIRGEIDLERRFPSLSKTRMETDVLIFWGFRLVSTDGRHSQLVAGASVLAKVGTAPVELPCFENLVSLEGP